MIDPTMIPPEAVRGLEMALLGRPLSARSCAAAIAAALAAWPGAWQSNMEEATGVRSRLILPLPQEPGDDQGDRR